MAQENENLSSGALYQKERNLRDEYNQVKYGDEGEQQNNQISRELKDIKQEWKRRSSEY